MAESVSISPEDLRNFQLLELEMMVEVDRICRKNHIQYSLDGGTLLGAIRHKGFVPWDDDADVIFTRHEYAKFYRACKKDLDTERFFLQEYRTDPYYRWGYAKLRRNDTEYIRLGQEHMKYRTGVCIDVFVVDHVPDNKVLRECYYDLNFCIRKVLYAELGKVQEKSRLMRMWYRLLEHIPRDCMFRIRNRSAALCNRKKTELVSHLLFQYPNRKCKYGMPSKCFEHYIEVEFEGMKFSAFRDYHEYLTLLYQDYMTLPPVEKRVGPAEPSYYELLPISLEEIQARYQKENRK
jgi:lipopolysaccharide cholinephosphotransferase